MDLCQPVANLIRTKPCRHPHCKTRSIQHRNLDSSIAHGKPTRLHTSCETYRVRETENRADAHFYSTQSQMTLQACSYRSHPSSLQKYRNLKEKQQLLAQRGRCHGEDVTNAEKPTAGTAMQSVRQLHTQARSKASRSKKCPPTIRGGKRTFRNPTQFLADSYPGGRRKDRREAYSENISSGLE